MDLHTQLHKNMEDLVKLFEARMENYDKALAEKTAQSSSTAATDLVKLATDFNSFKATVWGMLSLLKQQVELLATGMDAQEMRSRLKILLLHGVAEDSPAEAEDQVCAILKDHKIADIDPGSIEVCHRLGAKNDRPRPLLVRFATIRTRNNIWSKKTNLKGSGITVSEFLTKPRQELFVAARKHFGMRNCWTADGTILILLPDQTRKKVISSHELNTLIGKFPIHSSQADSAHVRPKRTKAVYKK